MTHAAVGELGSLDVVFEDQLPAQGQLIGGMPVHVVNFAARPDVFLRVSVAIQAPLHVKRVRFPCERHLIEIPMAGGAADAFGDVDAVIKENKIRGAIDAVPAQARVCGKALPDGGQHGRVFPDLRMTGHTRLCWRHAGKGGFFDIRMAIAAVQPKAPDVVFVAEGNRLRNGIHLPRHPWRPINGINHPHGPANEQHNGCKTAARERI